MQAGTILFNSVDLSRVGAPQLRISRTPDPPPPAAATRQRVSLAVVIQLDTHDPATQQARLEYLQQTMQVREGILRSESASGHYLEWMAVPAGDTLGEAVSGRRNSVELNFTAIEAHPAAQVDGLISATLTLPDATVLTFHALRDYSESISTERVSMLSTARKLTTTTISFTGRTLQTNPADDEATRWAALRSAQQQIKAANARYGTLDTGGESSVVRVQALVPRIDEERMALDVDIQCFRTDIPGDDNAVIEIDETISKDEGAGEIVFSYQGTITADDEATALSQLDAIVTAKQIATGGRVANLRFTPTRTAGGDTVTEEWIGTMPFSFQCRTIQATVDGYQVRLATTDDESGKRIVVTGTMRGTTPAAVIAKADAVAAELAGGSDPNRSEDTLDYTTEVEGSSRILTVLTFTREYRTSSDALHGSIEFGFSRGAFGEHAATLSGSLAGPHGQRVRAAARSLIPSGVCLRGDDERFSTRSDSTSSELRAGVRVSGSSSCAAVIHVTDPAGTLSGIYYVSDPATPGVHEFKSYTDTGTNGLGGATLQLEVEFLEDQWKIGELTGGGTVFSADYTSDATADPDPVNAAGWETYPEPGSATELVIQPMPGTGEDDNGFYEEQDGLYTGKPWYAKGANLKIVWSPGGIVGRWVVLDGDHTTYGSYKVRFASTEDVATPDLVTAWSEWNSSGEVTVEPDVSWLPEGEFTTLNFAYSWFEQHTTRSLKYSDSLAVNEFDMTEERTVSGTARATSEAEALAAIDELFATTLGLSNPARYSTGKAYEVCGEGAGAISTWIAVDFSRTFVGSITGTPGNDIIEASVSVQRTGGINRPIVHPVAYSTPIAQLDTGWTIPTLTVSASCKARTAATARGWVQAKRALATGVGMGGTTRHETSPPEEGYTDSYAPFESVVPTTRTFTGRYVFQFSGTVGDMNGVWPAGMD